MAKKNSKDNDEMLTAWDAYIKQIENIPVLSREETTSLVRKAQSGDIEARQKLMEHNLRFVVYKAKPYFKKFPTIPPLDIVQYGNEGLLKSLDYYEPDEAALTTYSSYWITNTIERNLFKDFSDITTPEDIQRNAKYYQAIMNKAKQAGKEKPSDDEIMELLNINESLLRRIKEYLKMVVVSLNKPLDNDKDSEITLEDFVPDNNVFKKPEDVIDAIDNFELMIVLKEKLGPLYYYVLYMRYLSEKNYSLEKIGKTFGIMDARMSVLDNQAKEMAKPYLADNHSLLHEEAKKIKQREKANYYNLSTRPIFPNEIINYLYLKNNFNEKERNILKDFLFHKYDSQVSTAARRLSLTETEYKKMLEQIKVKTKKIILENTDDYTDFAKNLIKTYKSKIFTLNLDEDHKYINYDYLSKRYGSLSLDEIKALYGDDYDLLPSNSKRMLEDYFGIPESEVEMLPKYIIEREVNLAIYNYQEQDFDVPKNKLYKIYKNNKSSFTKYQQDYLDSNFFGSENQHSSLIKQDRDQTHVNFGETKLKLERMYYGLDNLFWNFMVTKDLYEKVLKNNKDAFSEDKIKALNLFFGVGCSAKSIQEIAQEFDWTIEKTSGFLRHAREFVCNLYLNRTLKKRVKKNIYAKYINNPAYELTTDNRKILKYHVIDDLDYIEISKLTGLSKTRISNIITESLRKLDMYRYGILRATIITATDFSNFFKSHPNMYSSLEKKVLKLSFIDHLSPQEIAEKTGCARLTVNQINRRFIRAYKSELYKDMRLMPSEIKKELDSYYLDSVLSDEEKLTLSYFNGIPYSFNKDGIKLSNIEAAKRMGITEDRYGLVKYTATLKLKARLVGELEPEYMYMDRGELDNLLDDINLPISEKERDIICSFCELKGKKKLSFEELAEKYGDTKNSIIRRYQRAILNIFKYVNNEIDGYINFDTDISGYLKFFSKVEQKYLIDRYKDNLTYEAIAKKYKLSLDKVVGTFNNLAIKLDDVRKNSKRRFDYDYAETVPDDPFLPFTGNAELAKKIYNLVFNNETMERLAISEAAKRLNLNISDAAAFRLVIYFMIAISRRQDGIKRGNSFSNEEIIDYYERHKDDMAASKIRIYERHINRLKNHPADKFASRAHAEIRFDLIKEKYPDYFSLDSTTRERVLSILKNRQLKSSRRVRESLMQIFDISKREILSGAEYNHIYRLLNSLDLKLKMKDNDLSEAKKLELSH